MRATVVEEEKDMAEGNNDAHEEQEADIQQSMEELARNQEAEVALWAQIAAQERKQQQSEQERRNTKAQNNKTHLRIAKPQARQQAQAPVLASPSPQPNAAPDNVNFDFVCAKQRERSGGG